MKLYIAQIDLHRQIFSLGEMFPYGEALMEVSLATPLLAIHLLKTPSEVDCKSLNYQLKKKGKVCRPKSPITSYGVTQEL